MSEELLPEMMGVEHVGTFWIAKAQQTVWFVASNGAVVSLSELLLNAKPVAPPRHGRDGVDGVGTKGEPGRDAVGIQGPPGRDAVGIQGPPGINIKGERGEIGPQGFPGSDTAAVLVTAREQSAAIRAEFVDLKLQIQAVHEQNKQADAYLEFLRSRRAARK